MSTKTVSPTLEKDPVCGMNVDPATAKNVYQHAGRNYYFCCPRCVEKFKAGPEQYLNQPRPSGLISLGMPAAKPATAATTLDPVCGMTVNPSTAKHVHEHAGRRYYFCCAGCQKKFAADPAHYLNKPASSDLVTLGMPSAPHSPATVPLSSRAEPP